MMVAGSGEHPGTKIPEEPMGQKGSPEMHCKGEAGKKWEGGAKVTTDLTSIYSRTQLY